MSDFLRGVPDNQIRRAFDRAGGNEIASGKFASSESSAAVAANGFGWFLTRPGDLPAFPGLDDLERPATRGDVERQMLFPGQASAPMARPGGGDAGSSDRGRVQASRAVP